MSRAGALTSHSVQSVRYHSLDALRAFAMLMGIFLHAAWFFLPYESGVPIMDVAVNQPCNLFFYLTHVYRMQVFFLLAGFFARLVFVRIGYLGFVWHRFTRIAVPFAVGWLVMYPLFTLYWLWGGVQSGRILVEDFSWHFFWSRMWADEMSWFSLTHLWFLYYLLLIYGIAIALELLLRYVLDRRGGVRERIGRLFRWQMTSRLNVVWLAIPLFVCHWWMADWFGITTPSDSWRPYLPVLLAYCVFFFVGWLLHGQADLLRCFERGWGKKLVFGVLLSLPLFVFFTRGMASGTITWVYPWVFQNEILDYSAIRSAVRGTNGEGQQVGSSIIRDSLSPMWREFVEQTESPTLEQTSGLAWEMTLALILNPSAFQPVDEESRIALESLKAEAKRRGHPAISIDVDTVGTPLENRWLLEAALPKGTFASNIVLESWYQPAMATFSAGYALATWLLIFGSIGFFMRFFDEPNSLTRYIADSSYWLYIIHLPILCQIGVLMAEVRWHWIPKLAVYLIVTFAIMLPSYHYLVRSTWIGRILNGRTYPFRPWFRRPTLDVPTIDQPPLEPEAVAEA
jgi:peptidoglycan/LPS O-acetylase OafA/YrhL